MNDIVASISAHRNGHLSVGRRWIRHVIGVERLIDCGALNKSTPQSYTHIHLHFTVETIDLDGKKQAKINETVAKMFILRSHFNHRPI